MKQNTLYRKDIDGLRAVAVLLVILYHANVPYLTGGYIGVDVFFVISGFLITATINKEMIDGVFTFKSFYLRRIRRIIPVLIFVLLSCCIPAYLFLFAGDLEVFGRTLIHTVLSTNNFFLYLNQTSYFSDNADLIPLLHTWSLSVEEQFYILWPIMLLMMHKYITSKKHIWIKLLFLIGCFFYSIYATRSSITMAYFLLPARFFELLIGAFLAVAYNKLPVVSKLVSNVLSLIGLLLIILPAFLLTKVSLFPGVNALWPCLGAAILIYTGKNNISKGIINKLFEIKPLVFIGLISYSLYLWHWPIFTFIKYLGLQLDGILRIVSILVIFLLSYFSWRFVEQPFRTTFKYGFKKTLFVIFLTSFMLCLGIYALLDIKNGFPQRFPNLAEFNPKTNYPNELRRNCFDKFKIGNCEECLLGTKKDTLDGVLIGDSYANHTAAFLDVLAKDAGLYLHDCAAGGYPILSTLDKNGIPNFKEAFGFERLEYAKQFKTIYIAASWPSLSNPLDTNYNRILNTIGELVKLQKEIVIFDCLRPTTDLNLNRIKLLKTSKTVFFKERDFTIVDTPRANTYLVYEIKRRYQSIKIIDLNDAICADGKCDIQINNTIVYRNHDHLNTSGATLLGESYLKRKGNPLKKLDY